MINLINKCLDKIAGLEKKLVNIHNDNDHTFGIITTPPTPIHQLNRNYLYLNTNLQVNLFPLLSCKVVCQAIDNQSCKLRNAGKICTYFFYLFLSFR